MEAYFSVPLSGVPSLGVVAELIMLALSSLLKFWWMIFVLAKVLVVAIKV